MSPEQGARVATRNDGAPAPPSEGAGAPTLSYNVTQQVCHTGQNLIELLLDPADFIASAGAQEQAS